MISKRCKTGDEMADFYVIPASVVMGDFSVGKNFIVTVTSKGFENRMEIDDFIPQMRGRRGVIAIKFKEKAGGSRKSGGEDADSISCMRICKSSDDIFLSTSKGNIVRQRVSDLSIQSRAATGFVIQKLDKDDSIVIVDIVPPEVEEVSDIPVTQPTSMI
jgi:DNA gyrase subunit A